MSVGTYNTGALVFVLRSLENEPITFLRDRFFPARNTIQFESEEILFDIEDKIRRVAPFVSPLVEGKVVEQRGFSTRSVKPAYVKPKSIIDPNDLFSRTMGEQIGGSLTPAQRRDIKVREILEEHREMLDMREEVMASEALRLGQVTITGKGYGTLVVSFQRDAALTVALAGPALWSDPLATPLADIEGWGLLIRQKSGGAIVRNVIEAPDAFTNMVARLSDAEKTALFDSRRGSGSRIELGPRTAEKVKFEGTIGQFNFWTYADTYQDEDGVTQDIMPSGTVIMAAEGQLEGTPIYGAIRDASALRAMRRFPKTWVQQDPSVEYLMTQSAPLLVPVRANASLGATVL